MFQVEHYLIHRHPPFEEHSARIIQDKTRHQAKHQVPVVSVFTVNLARFGRQQMLQDAKPLLDQVAARPRPQQAGGLDWSGPTEQIETILFGFVQDDHRHRPIGRTLSPKPGIATTGRMQALLPGPGIVMNEVAPMDLTSIFKKKGLGGFALH